ncbi:MAG: hypothetical protein AAF557_03785 [Pseudomonadota bacterium]
MDVVVAAVSAVIAILSGTLLALARTFAAAPIRATFAAIFAIFRGVPLMVLLFSGVVFWNYFFPPKM